jgi:hypothetical protein
MTSHSAILGGSNAQRLLMCPASYSEQMKSPIADVESEYAAEGTALHAAISLCVEKRIKPQTLLGTFFGNYEIDADRVAVLDRALAELDALMRQYGGGFRMLALERTLPLPGVSGAFGSVDLIMVSKTTVLVSDWKFGAGVPVKAIYQDGDCDFLNPQLAFYTSAARAAYPRRFKGKKIVTAIIQPRLDPATSYAETDDQELDDFLAAFHAAFVEALGRNPHRERGDHCRFALCKATCPLWVGPVFELADLDPKAIRPATPPSDYGTFLSRALAMAKVAETWAEEIRKQGHLFLEDGGSIPYWKLVPKRGTRQWLDAEVAPDELLNLGADDDDVWTEPELRSVAQVEKRLKKRKIELPSRLYHTVSTGTTIAPDDDPRPNATRGEVVIELRQALKALG